MSFGRDVIVEFVDAVRDEVFLQQELERVGNGLTKSEKRDILLESQEGQRDTDTIGSHAVLNKRADLALGVNGVGNKAKNDSQQPNRLEERGPNQEYLGLERVGGEISHRREARSGAIRSCGPCDGLFKTLESCDSFVCRAEFAGQVHAKVANAAQRKSLERRKFGGNLFEEFVDGVNAI